MPFCGELVSYPVSTLTDEVAQDAAAAFDAAMFGERFLGDVTCPFFARKVWQCRRYFPECVNVTSMASPLGVEGMDVLICVDTCLRGRTANGGQCESVGRLSESWFNTECHKDNFYAAPPARCADVPDDTGLGSISQGLWWRIALGVGVGLIIIVALALMYRRHKRDQWSEARLREHDEKKARKLREKKAKEAEKEAKRVAKQQKKYDEKAGAASAGGAGGVVPASSASPPVPLAFGALDVASVDVELGALEGAGAGRLVASPKAVAGASASASAAASSAAGASSAAAASSPKGKSSHKKRHHGKDKDQHKGRHATPAERAREMHREKEKDKDVLQTPASRARTMALQRASASASAAAAEGESQSSRSEGQSSPRLAVQQPVRLHMVAEAGGGSNSASAPPLLNSQWDAWKAGQPTRVALPEDEV
jgi:hypothetical protein